MKGSLREEGEALTLLSPLTVVRGSPGPLPISVAWGKGQKVTYGKEDSKAENALNRKTNN